MIDLFPLLLVRPKGSKGSELSDPIPQAEVGELERRKEKKKPIFRLTAHKITGPLPRFVFVFIPEESSNIYYGINVVSSLIFSSISSLLLLSAL